MNRRKLCSARGALGAALVVASIPLLPSAAQAQRVTVSTNPPTGVAGVDNSYVTGSGFPAGAISAASVVFGTGCSGPAVAVAPVIQVAVEGPLRRFEFLIPASVKTGTYDVWVKGTAGTTSFNTLGTPSCSTITVSNTSTTLAACVPTSSLAVTAGAAAVNAYVPFGYWEGGLTGIEQVLLEGTGPAATNFSTTGNVNSCASNSSTGEVVCTENGANVDLINGSTLTTLTSGTNAFAEFTGGSCENCGVAINAQNNTAVIAMGLVGGGGGPFGGGGSGLQVLDLATNTFSTPDPLAHYVSEDISIDSGRNLILSPDESGFYDLLKIAGNTLTEYGNDIGNFGGDLDSAAEDCTTGIALSAVEFTDDIYITDLTQATFTAGSPGTWTAPGGFVSLGDPEGSDSYSAGTSGISSAPGTSHLAVVTGEFGGSSYSALLLPSTSGSGTPALVDHAWVSNMPDTPDGNPFSAGFDPHTVTAYTSPITGASYAVFADYELNNYLGIVDLACVLAQPRTAGTHTVIGDAASCTRYVPYP
jgi:hypothetical protein